MGKIFNTSDKGLIFRKYRKHTKSTTAKNQENILKIGGGNEQTLLGER